MAGGKKSANCSSEITLTVKNQDGDRVSITLNRRTQVKTLLHSYCEQKELDVNSVVLRYSDFLLHWEQTPNQLGMVDGDEICVFNVISLGSNVQESTDTQSQGQDDNIPCDVQRILDFYTFDELEAKTTRSFEQAMEFLKASFHKANHLAEDAQNSREDIKIKYDSLNEVVNVGEKKVAEKDLLIVKLHRELQQANANIRSLNKEQSRRDEELLKVKQELLTAKEEILCKEVEYCTGKRAAVAGPPSNELKKARQNELGTEQSPVAQVCMRNEEHKKSTDGSAHITIEVYGLAGDPVFFKMKRNTELKALMGAYCEQKKKNFEDIKFFFADRQIRAQQTPDELEMEDGSMIDVIDLIW